MKVLDEQVHVFELLGLAAICLVAFAVGYSLNLLAMVLFVFWPILLLELILQGALIVVFNCVRRLIFGPCAPQQPAAPVPRRHGLARWLWHFPFAFLALGWLKHYFDTGTWFGI